MKNRNMFVESEKNPGQLDPWSFLLPIAFDLVCGILLIALGNLALRVTAYALAGAMVVSAAVLLIQYLRSEPLKKITHAKLAISLALVVAGILLAFNPDYLSDFLPFVWGLAMLFGAFLKIQYAFDEKSLKIEKWWIMLIFAAFSLVIGILSLLNPDFLGDSRSLVIGIMLVAEAVIDVVVYLLISKALKKLASGAAAGTPASAPAAETPAAAPASAPAAEEPAAVPVPEAPADNAE